MSPQSHPETERFQTLLDRCERVALRGVPFDEVRELGRLYRSHTARLARLRQSDDDPEAIRSLNALCVRAYTFLYTPSSRPRDRGSFAADLRSALARTWHAQLVAWSLLALGLAMGAMLASRDTDALPLLVPASLGYSGISLDELLSSPSARQRFLDRGAVPAGVNAVFGSMLFANNTRVGLLSFATGILGGVPTVLLQLYNGLVLGAFATIFLRDPWPIHFLAWILPHGIPEFTAITWCAAAGLTLGAAVAAPERDGRTAALRRAAAPALLLFLGSLPLFAVAALIESFVRESALSASVRLTVAAAMATALLAVMLWVRSLSRRGRPDTSWLSEISDRARSGWRDSGSKRPV